MNLEKNARSYGVNLLFVMMWVLSWSLFEKVLERLVVKESARWWIYLGGFILVSVLFLLVDTCPC